MLTFNVDTSRFTASFRKYVELSKKSLTDIVNNKACRVALAATRNTKRADKGRIEAELGRFVTVQAINKRGKAVRRRKLQLATRDGHAAPLVALIINKRRGNEGLPGLQGNEMESAARRLVAARFRSIGFAASGWLGAVKKLVGALKDRSGIRIDRSVKVYGRLKGDATPARGGWSPLATISNNVSKGGAKVQALISHGAQEALDAETKDMDTYIARKLSEHSNTFNRP